MKKTIAATLTLLLVLANFSAVAYAQGALELRGTVLDETRAYIPAVQVVLEDGQGKKYTAQTDEMGRYRFAGLKPGLYTITVETEGFAKFSEPLDLTQKRATPFDITLKVFISEQLEVKNDAPGISADPDQNLTAVTLKAEDLEALPDDPDELLETLRQMAGASGDEASIYVGGFRERGRIPPKEAIQMIRINSNPFSAEFSEVGFSRIEIVTKPGSDTFHGGFRLNFNDESLNARNTFAPFRAPLQVRSYGGNFSGPIIRNRWGFFMNVDRRVTDENEVINATVLDDVTLLPERFVATVLTPSRNFNFDIRTDYLATKKHTLGFGYRYNENKRENLGIDTFDLPERGFNRTNNEHTLRLSLTSIVTEQAVNEVRVQLSRRTTNTRAFTEETAIIVPDAFSAGGNQGSLFQDNSNENLDFTDNLTYTYKKHIIKAGVRVEAEQFKYLNRSNFGGTFTFGSDFERDANGNIIDVDGNVVTGQAGIPISPLESFRRVTLGLAGYRPVQFSINRGDPFVGFSQWEMGAFVQDDWRASERLTLSYGLRYEAQTQLQDKINFAPRFGLAWVPDQKKRSTIRAGAGIFYDNLDSNITFDTLRNDGERQQQFIIQSPNFFPNIPTDLNGAIRRQPTIRLKAEDLIAPYSINTTVSYERQLPWKMFGSVAYSWFRGVHLLRLRNINAPLPGSFDGDGQPIRPFPDKGPMYQYESTGLSNRHEMRVSLRSNISRALTLFANYTLGSTRSDTDGNGTIPVNSYDFTGEYGRSNRDARHQVFVGGSFTLPWNLRVSPFLNANSGRPFNITTGRDNNRDTTINDRPAFASAGDPGAIVTPFGIFNPNPQPGDEIIPRNFGQGPGFWNVNMSVSKTFGFGNAASNFPGQAANRGGQQQGQDPRMQAQNQRGPRGDGPRGGGPRGGGGGGPRGGGGFGGPGGFFGNDRSKYNLTLSINARNLLNHTNFSGFNSVLTSPVFGLPSRAQEGRRIEASLRFSF
jgi:hypothetical protein